MNSLDDTTYQQLLNACFRFLSYRPRSEKEVRDFIAKTLTRKKIYAQPLISPVIDRLTELGYINDAKFAEWFVSQRSGRKPRGKRLVEQELKRKGIAESDITVVRNERELATQSVQKKMTVWRSLPQIKQKQKIYAYLLRRGFDAETVCGVVDELVGKGYNKKA